MDIGSILDCLTKFWIRLRSNVSTECMVPEQPFQNIEKYLCKKPYLILN